MSEAESFTAGDPAQTTVSEQSSFIPSSQINTVSLPLEDFYTLKVNTAITILHKNWSGIMNLSAMCRGGEVHGRRVKHCMNSNTFTNVEFP